MLSPALALSLLACATAHTPGLGGLPAGLPPWGAALFAKVGAMEGEISAMKTTIASQNGIAWNRVCGAIGFEFSDARAVELKCADRATKFYTANFIELGCQ